MRREQTNRPLRTQ